MTAPQPTHSGPSPDGKPPTVQQCAEDRQREQAKPSTPRARFWGEDA